MTSLKLRPMIDQLIIDKEGINPFYNDVSGIVSFSDGTMKGKLTGLKSKVQWNPVLRCWQIV